MKLCQLIGTGLATAFVLGASISASAQNIADATLEMRFTLTDVTITDQNDNSRSATFETTSEVGDVLFSDFGPNGNTRAGGGGNNPPNSTGSASAMELISLNGLDPFVDDYDQDSFGIGDSVVSTMITIASATTPESVFFAQVDSINEFYFETFIEDTERLTFHWDYEAVLTGSLDSLALDGVTLAFAEGNSVAGSAEGLDGDDNDFFAANDFFNLGKFNQSKSFVSLDESASGSFNVAFDAGDSNLSIIFDTQLLVNARVAAVPEPGSLGLLSLAVVPAMLNRRRQR